MMGTLEYAEIPMFVTDSQSAQHARSSPSSRTLTCYWPVLLSIRDKWEANNICRLSVSYDLSSVQRL